MWIKTVLVGPYDDPLSLQVMQAACAIVVIRMLLGEITGDGLRYSKFARTSGFTLPPKVAWGALYLPPSLLCAAFLLLKLSHSPLLPAASNPRLLLVASAFALHFLKRCLEVLFVHKFSGSMEVRMIVLIAGACIMTCVLILYAQQIAAEREEPAIDLKVWGVGVFLVGIVGNFYHHYLLATLRSDKEPKGDKKRYKVPHGGLFTWVVCPHYLFESIDFLGIAMMSQTSAALLLFMGLSSCLCARSYKTKAWYLQNVEGFPPQRKPFFPFLF
ncbi:hypothetical protein L7F22_055383 [Adiantum nelumboides]|nr:hypothetical protein [Adiantum nelumboides]